MENAHCFAARFRCAELLINGIVFNLSNVFIFKNPIFIAGEKVSIMKKLNTIKIACFLVFIMIDISCRTTSVKSVHDDPGGSGNVLNSRMHYHGTYDVTVSDFKGVLTIEKESNRFNGSIRFFEWGNQQPQDLKNLRIRGNSIYFVRSVETKEELERLKSSRYFKQEFYGKYSDNGNFIKGYYTDSGIEKNWFATRKSVR